MRKVLRNSLWAAMALVASAVPLGRLWWCDWRPLCKARSACARQDWPRALGWLATYLRDHPDHAEAQRLAARTLAHLGRYQEAESLFALASDLDEPDLLLRCEVLTLMRRFPEAARICDELLRRDPRHVAALTRMSLLELAQGRVENACQLARQLTQIPEAEVTGHVILGVILHELEPSMAADYFRKVLAHNPEFSGLQIPAETLWRDYGKALLNSGRCAESRDALQRVGDVTGDPELLCLIGQSYLQQGQAQESEPYLRRAIQCDPNYGPALLALGQLALDGGQAEEALGYLLRANRALLDSRAVHYALGRAYRLLGRDSEAEQEFNMADQLH